MRRRTASTARASWVVTCLRNCGGARTGWRRSARPDKRWKRKQRAAARDRAKQAADAEAAVADAEAADADASEQQKLRDKAVKAQEKAQAAKDLAIQKADEAGLEPHGLEPQASDSMPYRGLAHRADGSPTAAASGISPIPTAIMKSDGNLLQGYNCQAVVDGDHQVIVAMGVSNQSPDPEHLVPMLERTIANTGQIPKTLLGDTGYWSEDNAAACEKRGVDPYIATGRLPHGQPPPPIFGPIPKDLDAKGRMAASCARRRKRDLRQAQDDRGAVFGQTKRRGLRRFAARAGRWMVRAALGDTTSTSSGAT